MNTIFGYFFRGRASEIALVLMFLALTLLSQKAVSAELLMLEQEGCVYCERFNREIAPAYPKSAEGKLATLRRIDIHEDWPEDLAGIKPATLTPTFILVENNQEFGRLHGYAGNEYFWFLLDELFENMKSEQLQTSK